MPTTTIAEVMPGYPADFAGIRPGDKCCDKRNAHSVLGGPYIGPSPGSGQTISLTLREGRTTD